MSIPAQGAVGAETMTAGRVEALAKRLHESNPGAPLLAWDGLWETMRENYRTMARAALASPRAGSDERTAGAILTEACKPWEHYSGEPPDDGSPLSGVFVAGMVYTERLLAKLLDVTHYEGGDGSEDFDTDATQTLRNILTGARLWDADENRPVASTLATPPGVPDDVRVLSEAATAGPFSVSGVRKRYDEASCIIVDAPSCGGLFAFATADGREALAALADAKFIVAAANHVRDLIASRSDEQSEDDPERCEICGTPVIAGQRVMQDVELGTVHAACCGPEREAYVKDVETGEPLGPNDPIPQGYVYQPETADGPSVRTILARLWCQAEGNDPDDTISDAGHTVLDGTLGGLDKKAFVAIIEAERAILKATTPPGAPRYQYREIGEGEGWRDCSRESYLAFASDPHIDTREVSATPAQPAGAVPDSLRALSEAATKGEWYTESEKCDGSYGSGEDCGEGYLAYSILTDAEPRYGNPGVIAETSNSTLGVIHEESDEDGFTAWDETARANTAFIVAAVKHVRSLLASHPAGQSAGSGERIAEIVNRWHDWIVSASADMDQPEWSSGGRQTMEDDRDFLLRALPAPKPAPDSTRTGQAEADLDWAVARWRAEVENRPLQNVHRRALDTTWRQVIRRFGGDPDALIGPSHDELADASPALAARPAAPEAQGAERVRHVKRGTEYEVLHRGVELQVALTRPFCLGHLNLPALEEGNRLAIYRGADGKLWAREEGEFDDGRFVPAPPASSGQEG